MVDIRCLFWMLGPNIALQEGFRTVFSCASTQPLSISSQELKGRYLHVNCQKFIVKIHIGVINIFGDMEFSCLVGIPQQVMRSLSPSKNHEKGSFLCMMRGSVYGCLLYLKLFHHALRDCFGLGQFYVRCFASMYDDFCFTRSKSFFPNFKIFLLVFRHSGEYDIGVWFILCRCVLRFLSTWI